MFECIFMYNYLFICLLLKNVQVPPLIFNQYIFLPLIYRIFCLFWIQILYQINIQTVFFSLSVTCLFIFLIVCLMSYSFKIACSLPILFIIVYAFCQSTKIPRDKATVFHSRSFMVLSFPFTSKIYLELIFVYVMRQRLRLTFFPMDIQLFQHHLFYIVLSQLNCLVTFVEKQVTVYVWSSSRLFHSINLYIFLPVIHP